MSESLSETEQRIFDEFTESQPNQDGVSVYLTVDHKAFELAYLADTPEEAVYERKKLAIAIARITETLK